MSRGVKEGVGAEDRGVAVELYYTWLVESDEGACRPLCIPGIRWHGSAHEFLVVLDAGLCYGEIDDLVFSFPSSCSSFTLLHLPPPPFPLPSILHALGAKLYSEKRVILECLYAPCTVGV